MGLDDIPPEWPGICRSWESRNCFGMSYLRYCTYIMKNVATKLRLRFLSGKRKICVRENKKAGLACSVRILITNDGSGLAQNTRKHSLARENEEMEGSGEVLQRRDAIYTLSKDGCMRVEPAGSHRQALVSLSEQYHKTVSNTTEPSRGNNPGEKIYSVFGIL